MLDLDVTANFSIAFVDSENVLSSFNIAQGDFNGGGVFGGFSI